MTTLQLQELDQLFYMYEQTYKDIKWQYMGYGKGFIYGLCDLIFYWEYHGFISYKARISSGNIIKDFLDNRKNTIYGNSGILKPKLRKKAFYRIKREVFGL